MKLAPDPDWHPCAEAVERFLGGESPRPEAMAIVRHVLRGCPRCSLVFWVLWERRPKKRPAAAAPIRRRPPGQAGAIEFHWKRRSPLVNQLKAARQQLLAVTHDLDAIKFRLLGVQASLPAGAVELDRFLEADQTDQTTDVRTALACLLRDYLEPAIGALEAILASLLARRQDDRRGESGA